MKRLILPEKIADDALGLRITINDRNQDWMYQRVDLGHSLMLYSALSEINVNVIRKSEEQPATLTKKIFQITIQYFQPWPVPNIG